MDNAWSPQDIAPSNTSISIPAQDSGGQEDSNYANGGERSSAPARRSSRSRSPGDRGSRADEGNNPGNNLHVSGLSNKVDTRDLEAAFAKVGRVSKASVVYDPHTRESRLFGFVTMETAEEADAAITALNATEMMGKVITVQKDERELPHQGDTTVPANVTHPIVSPFLTSLVRPLTFHHPDDRPYDPRPYDSRYARDFDDRKRRDGGRSRYEDRDRYRDYDRDKYRDDRDRYREDRDRYRDDRRYDDRRY
ncbi:hypothetical protein VNI00_005692 [Paramarasmius palmivorus]|uniref:RRM domain-containing protein n=1 Tax=Paramarasmius palmivorus TaxID=297713 RepID=A0AAW0DB67_9AGAR